MQATGNLDCASGRSVIAVDVGGTNIKYGLVSLSGSVLAAGQIETFGARGAAQMFDRLLPLLRDYLAAGPIGVAVSTLGIIRPDNGEIVMAADAIADYHGDIIVRRLGELGLPVAVENDVNCVALAEGWVGATRGVDNYIALTLGTGIGGGIVIDRHLYRGHGQGAGEWGYMLIDGQVWEDVASLRGLATLANAAIPGRQWSARSVFEASDHGDMAAAQVIDRWYRALAAGICNLVYVFNPQALVVGGGITARGQRFQEELDHYLCQVLRQEFYAMTRVCLASAGNHAGLLGASLHWLQHYKFC